MDFREQSLLHARYVRPSPFWWKISQCDYASYLVFQLAIGGFFDGFVNFDALKSFFKK